MYAVPKGEFLTLKHASVGLGLHSLTGQKLPLQVLSRLGHSMTYDQIFEVETAPAELVQHLKSLSLPLPICPIDEESKVLTTFWWDDFDRNIETASGAGSIHNTPGIMLQEESTCTSYRNENVSIPKSKRHSVRLEDVRQIQATAINPKNDPPSFAEKDPVQVEIHEQMYCNNLLIVWKSLRHLTALGQVNPRFVGWVILFFETIGSKQTKLTYLPPIQKPITEYATFF